SLRAAASRVYSSADASWEERILYDVAYVRCCSFWLDLHIMLRTIFVVLLGESRTCRPFCKTRFTKIVCPPHGYFQDHNAG
ncbi:MAG: sugar transferase, partial [Planctomycetota bacterium]